MKRGMPFFPTDRNLYNMVEHGSYLIITQLQSIINIWKIYIHIINLL